MRGDIMSDRSLFTREAAINEAAAAQDNLALSKLRLFDGTLIPDATTTKADLVAAETLLVGYPAGGYALAAFSDPDVVAVNIAAITTPLTAIQYASGAEATIGGAWIEDADGGVRRVFIFDPVRTLAAVGDGFQFLRQLLYGGNAV
jgi:hypothetical protein